METSNGAFAAVFKVRESSASCCGLSTLRLKRMTPPTPRAMSSSSSTVGTSPWMPTITQRAARASKSIPTSISVACPTTNSAEPRLPAAATAAKLLMSGKQTGVPPVWSSRLAQTAAARDSGALPDGPAASTIEQAGKRTVVRSGLYPVEQQSRRFLRSVAVSLAAVVALVAAPAGAAPDGRDILKKSVDQLLSQPPLAGSRASVDIVSLDDGSTIYSHDGDAALNPASNTKLITAAAALLRLGPEYRFDTDVLADHAPDKRGKVGTLYVRGHGDPSITTERLTGMVRDLFHRGVRSVGDLVIDDSYFDAEKWGPGWEQESSDKAYAAPVGALSLNHNTVAIYVRPGDRAGAKGVVELEPEAPGYFQLSARVATVRTNGRRKVRPHPFELRDGTQVTVDGRVPAGGEPMVFFRRVTEPGMYLGQTLRATLLQNGIRVTGRGRRAVTPASAYLVTTYDSEELAEIVRDMNKVSSNFIAEMLIKTLGAELRGPPGTWAKGIDVAEELLAEVGLPRGSYQLKNGSGLNDTNRFSAHQMVTLLTAIWKKFPVASEFVSSLGIAARDGTLRLRMEGTDAAGRLRAKTGTLDRVTALSGFVQS